MTDRAHVLLWTDRTDAYLDALRELVLPQTAVLVGNHKTLTDFLLPEWDAAKVEAEARLLLAHHQGDVLILTDMLGATPANGAQRLAGDHVRVVSGLNVPMLWRALCYRQQALDVIADKALTGACVHELGCTS